MSLYRVWRVAKKISAPVIGGGGIDDADSAIEFLLAGAKAVSIGTINMVYPDQAKVIVEGIKTYMRKKRIGNIEELSCCSECARKA